MVHLARVGQKLKLVAEVEVIHDIQALVLGYMFRDRMGHVVWGTNTWHTKQRLAELAAGARVIFVMPFTCSLGPGSYSISPALVSTETHLVNNYEWIDNLMVFDVMNADQPVFAGTSYVDARFDISVAP